MESRWGVTADDLNTKQAACDEDVAYPIEREMDDQGRRATNPVSRLSMLAGRPIVIPPPFPPGIALGRYRISRRNRLACAWRSCCAAAAAIYEQLARRVAGH